MHPTGFILATHAAHRDTHSARPDAPVVPAKAKRPRRPSRASALRQATATSLRGLAARIEPRHDTEPCGTAMS
jgi:hypothetical protein